MLTPDQLERFKVPLADAIEIAERDEGGIAYAAECVVDGNGGYTLVKMLVQDDIPRLWRAHVHGLSGDILETGEVEGDEAEIVGDIIILEERLPELALTLAQAVRMVVTSVEGDPVAVELELAPDLLDLRVDVVAPDGPTTVIVDGLGARVRA